MAYSIFFTGDGVMVLENETNGDYVKTSTESVVCRDSWIAHMGDAPCPVIMGSQTNNSALVANADRALGL